MYCPKCGAQNQEDLAYCRECGEDLKIISQAMKKHLPIALVSKLDAVIEKKNERFRRDAVLNALAGTVFLVSAVFILFGGNFFTYFNLPILLFAIGTLFSSCWSFLAYRRSLELKIKPADVKFLPSYISPVESASGTSEAETNKLFADNNSQAASIYCPRCGVKNLGNVLYCRDCGTTLDFGVRPQGMEKYLPGFIVNKLDAQIEKNEETDHKPRYKSGWGLVMITSLFLFCAVMQVGEGNWQLALIYLVLGFVFPIGQGWELVAYRRKLERENKSSAEPLNSVAGQSRTFLSNNWKLLVALFSIILVCSQLLYFQIETDIILKLLPPLIFGVIIIFVALFLKFKQNSLQKDKECAENTSDLATSEFPSQDTLPLTSSPPLSITEATTKPIDLEAKKIEKEEILITQKLVKPNR